MAQARPRASSAGGATKPRRPVSKPEEAPAVGPQQPVCSFGLCPICMALSAIGDARPEVVEHVLLASREMLLAVRALIDARLETSPEPEGASKVERLTIT